MEFAGTVTGCAGKRSPPASCCAPPTPAAAGVKTCGGNGSATRRARRGSTAGTASVQPAPRSARTLPVPVRRAGVDRLGCAGHVVLPGDLFAALDRRMCGRRCSHASPARWSTRGAPMSRNPVATVCCAHRRCLTEIPDHGGNHVAGRGADAAPDRRANIASAAPCPSEGPLATRTPFTYSTKRLSAVTLTGSFAGTRSSCSSRRKCSTMGVRLRAVRMGDPAVGGVGGGRHTRGKLQEGGGYHSCQARLRTTMGHEGFPNHGCYESIKVRISDKWNLTTCAGSRVSAARHFW